MRNLKKFLALVLAMMMAFSLMVTANAAKDVNAQDIYPDADKITEQFVEAVDVLYGMGVMTGDYGSFKADQGIMRSEMAAVLYRLMTGDTAALKNNLYAAVASERFIDVSADAWFAPYVGWCYDAGIMVGSGGYFRPTANVTGYETLVMVLRAMGYGKNGEYTGKDWYINASSDGTLKGLLKDVNNTHYANTLAQNTRRDVVASIVFQAAQLPTVRYELGYYNPYVGVASGQGNNVLNPSLGEINFGLTSHYGIVVGNQASGETGNYATKIGFSVNPTTSSNISGNQAAWATNRVLTGAEITDAIDAAAYYYLSDNDATNGTAENVTLSFDWKTDLSLFNHKVKVWYDARGNGSVATVALGTANGSGSATFGTNCKTYALYDEAAAWVDTAAWTLTGATGDIADVFGAGVGTFFNYSFARMAAANQVTSGAATTIPSVTEESPMKANNGLDGLTGATTEWPLYLAIDNTGNGNADVVISLNLTISQVAQDNNTVVPLTTGIVNQNDSTGAATTNSYFDVWDQLNPTVGFDYAVIANKNITDSEGVSMNLNDYVAGVTVTGTTGNNDGTDDGDSITAGTAGTAAYMGNATLPNPNVTTGTMGAGAAPLVSTFYYKLANVNKTVTKSLWKYDPATQEVFFSDGTSLKQSIFALAVDGSFKAHQYVMAPTNSGEYTFYLDESGNYLFWEQASAKSTFVYGTYIDWQTELASSEFIYPMVYTNDQGEQKLVQNITKVNGAAMDITRYDAIELPKRDSGAAGNNSGFVKGIYLGYAMNSKGELTTVGPTANSTGFVQATNGATDFGSADITINKNSLAIGAVAVGNSTSPNLFLTNDTKFIVVDGAGKANQSVKVYNGLAELLGEGNTSVTLWTNTALQNASASNARYEGAYLNKDLLDAHDGTTKGTQATDNPYGLVYYSEKPFEYGQNYDPSARAVETVFIPAQMVTRTASVSGDLFFVGNNAVNLINADDNATLYTMYQNGEASTYWIQGMPNATAGDGVNDADIVNELGNNVFYQLTDTGRTAHDGGKIYGLLPLTWTAANAGLIGNFYGEDNTNTVSTSTASTTLRITNAAAGTANGYLATTYSSQVAYIGDLDKAEATTETNQRGDEDLFNVGSAKIKNLDRNYFSGTTDLITSLAALNNTSSYTNNMGVDVSCILNTDAYHTVSMIYVNYR